MRPKSFIRTLRFIHLSLCAGVGFFAVLAYFLTGGFYLTTENSFMFIYLVPILAITGYFGSKIIYQNLIRNLPKNEPLTKKLRRYQIATTIKYAFLEVPAFLALGAYYFSGNPMDLVIALCLLAYMIVQLPSLGKLKNELPLSSEQKKEFDTLIR